MVSRNISSALKEFSFRAVYDTGVLWDIQFDLVDHNSGNIEGWGYISRPGKPDKYTVMEKIVLSSGTGLTPGCKRLYYQAGKITFNKLTPNLTLDYHRDILFKGHYDVEVN